MADLPNKSMAVVLLPYGIPLDYPRHEDKIIYGIEIFFS
jgi:hypothetical protein